MGKYLYSYLNEGWSALACVGGDVDSVCGREQYGVVLGKEGDKQPPRKRLSPRLKTAPSRLVIS